MNVSIISSVIVITWSKIIEFRDLVLINERPGQKSREAVSLSSFKLAEKSLKQKVLDWRLKQKKYFQEVKTKPLTTSTGSLCFLSNYESIKNLALNANFSGLKRQ